MIKNSIVVVLLFIVQVAYGQIKFTQIPMDSELVARNVNTNLGTIALQGQVDSAATPYDTVCLKVFRSGLGVDSVFQSLSYVAGIAQFNFSYQIPAELNEYMVKIIGIKNTVQTIDTTINAIVAGDVYIIEGQSNAFAEGRDGGSANGNKSEFIRAFGNADSNTAVFLTYLKWGVGQGDGGLTEHGHMGQWGLRLARLLLDTLKIPIAVFNGACGGTPISYYERLANYKTNLNSNYAREYYRFTLTGLQNNVRAIIWSQGETDALQGTSTAKYITEFDTLEKAWHQDYPGFEKTYIFQTRNGGMPTYPFLNLQVIKEAQREIALNSNSNIEIMSTSALRQDSGDLHFDYTGGYEIFGNRIYNLIARDIYNIQPTREIDAPMMTSAYLSDSTKLIVTENSDSLIRHNPGKPIQDYEIENALGANIDSIYLNKNKVVFKLSKYPGPGITVSYLAQPTDSGNWVTNTNDIEVLCYYEHSVIDSMASPTGITEYTSPGTFKTYPNPFHQLVNIQLSTVGVYIIELDDITGREIKSIEFSGTHYVMHTEELTSGLYFLRVLDKQGNIVGTTKLLSE